MPRKRPRDEQPSAGKQISFRAPPDLERRLEYVAKWLGLDGSNLVRMILVENIAQYERRARLLEQEAPDQTN